MKALERFLVMFCLVAVIVRASGATDGIMMQIIAFVALGGYYLLFTFFILQEISFKEIFQRSAYENIDWKAVAMGIFAGCIFAFSAVSVLCYSIWQRAFDEQITMSVALLLIVVLPTCFAFRKRRKRNYKLLLIRAGLFICLSLLTMVILQLH